MSTRGNWKAMSLIAAVGDVGGDGKGDVLARSAASGYTRVYRGDGAGRVNMKGVHATKQFRDADLVIGAGDWNGDRKADVLMRSKPSGYLYLVPGKGKGLFGARVLLSKVVGRLLRPQRWRET